MTAYGLAANKRLSERCPNVELVHGCRHAAVYAAVDGLVPSIVARAESPDNLMAAASPRTE